MSRSKTLIVEQRNKMGRRKSSCGEAYHHLGFEWLLPISKLMKTLQTLLRH